MIIGVDIDSTIAEWPEVENWHELDPSELKPFDDSAEILNDWKAEGADIQYVTFRSEDWRAGIMPKTIAWLKKWGFPNPEIVHSASQSKGPLLVQIGAKFMIEDDIQVCEDCKKFGIQAFIHMVPYNMYSVSKTRIQRSKAIPFWRWTQLDFAMRSRAEWKAEFGGGGMLIG